VERANNFSRLLSQKHLYVNDKYNIFGIVSITLVFHIPVGCKKGRPIARGVQRGVVHPQIPPCTPIQIFAPLQKFDLAPPLFPTKKGLAPPPSSRQKLYKKYENRRKCKKH